MSWLKRKKVVVRVVSLLVLSGCTLNANDVQLREETASAFKTNTQAIETLARITTKLIEVLKAKGIITDEDLKK